MCASKAPLVNGSASEALLEAARTPARMHCMRRSHSGTPIRGAKLLTR